MSSANKLTKDAFIAKARAVHGDAYDYSHAVYVNNATLLRIDCCVPGHGPFWQAPGNHCRGNGCPACSSNRRVSAVLTAAGQKFLAKAKSIHGELYDYAETVYTGGKSELTIRCPRHGPFQQIVSLHLDGSGCPACEAEGGSATRKKALERFKTKAAACHGDSYDYSEVEYVNFQTRVKIGCRTHGPFYKLPTQHLAGAGCPACGMERGAAARRDGLEGFVAKAVARHSDVYDYSEVEYVNSRTKVKIGCPIHGPFYKIPALHVSGAGCPACGLERRGRTSRSET